MDEAGRESVIPLKWYDLLVLCESLSFLCCQAGQGSIKI